MFRSQFGVAVFLVLVSMPAMVALAEPPDKVQSSSNNKPDVMEILRQADAATKAVKAFTYEGEFYGVGALKDRVPHVKGILKAKQGKRSLVGAMLGMIPTNQLMRFDGTVLEPGCTEQVAVRIACDGKQAYRIDDKEKVFIHGEMPEAAGLLGTASAIYMREYLFPTPFSDELEGKVARYEGTKDVNGTECDVVFIVYQNDSESRWYFGRKDHLPHRVDRLTRVLTPAGDRLQAGSQQEGEENGYVIAIKALNTDPSFDSGDFRLKRPKGYEVRRYDARAEKDSPPLLKEGTAAPDWELPTPDGNTVSLKSLRGNVVVMDFWATWCGPCKMAMPGVQKLHEQFKDRPVKVFGISTWERGGDPAEYMKSKKYSYTLLLKGDKVADAYKISGLPTFYVIGPDGKVLYASKGFEEKKEAEIAKIIKEHMEKQ